MIRAHEYPQLEAWYWDMDQKKQFEIVAKDDKAHEIEIQYFSGEIEELDEDMWFSMHLLSIGAPSDWTGPYEIERDQYFELDDEVILPVNHSDLFILFEEEK